jgi:hypothetical protein
MKIRTNYPGSSIDIIEEKENRIIVSPKLEGKKYSNYYNFIVSNDDKEGIIVLKNINNQQYNAEAIPLVGDMKGNYIKLDKARYEVNEDSLEITVKPNEEFEVSSYPRYTKENLDAFLSTIDSNEVTINSRALKEIIIGDKEKEAVFIIGRQHPGETLSSYFIEGVINSIIDNKLYDNKCFVIYPIVNEQGVEDGNHRFTLGYDYNRMWNTTGVIEEIDHIKSQMEDFKVKTFIDVHCDEVTKQDYIRTKEEDIKNLVDNIQVLADQSQLKRFVRALVKQRKIINVFDKTAREYVQDKYGCESILIELSLSNIDREERYNLGYSFISKMMGATKDETHINSRKR